MGWLAEQACVAPLPVSPFPVESSLRHRYIFDPNCSFERVFFMEEDRYVPSKSD